MATFSTVKVHKLRKEFLISQVRKAVEGSALTAVVNIGNLKLDQKVVARRKLEEAGGSLNLTKNSLMSKGFERAGAEGLIPLCRGTSAIATGPAEVPLAKSLLELSKEMPSFLIMGALLNRERLLEVRALLCQRSCVPGISFANMRSSSLSLAFRSQWTWRPSRSCRQPKCCTRRWWGP